MEDYLLLIVYVASLIIMSLITFAVFCKDKKIAEKQNGQMRIKEKTLLGLTVMNGAIGAFVGRKVAHHKTDKVYFSITINLALVCQLVVLAIIAVLSFM